MLILNQDIILIYQNENRNTIICGLNRIYFKCLLINKHLEFYFSEDAVTLLFKDYRTQLIA